MTEALNIRELRARLAEVVTQAEAGEITVITRKGERVGAVVPIEVLDAIEEAEDELLAREARKHLDEPVITMAELLVDLFGSPEDSAGNAA
ncbi:type II toxin-antitoxin system Phd/YefM family antitoxin [Streptomyces sp. CBMA156]|uniref:type II toxin-antitoxin system Phd/YefM family antitoxin n=1 Tax=Streptomyces sp. CBMA156 TaxID=1930280 RepID=UPI001661C874|nr:type II toxin-antitoxin system Phd/YefM family antitoxin [Streptomyces sp. CBMA156]MBD0674463.1 prevent-host-death protein [Streptomyces sp. CBMA156]